MILQWLASPEWANLIKALLHTLWQGAIIAVLLGFALRRLDNSAARYRCSLAALGGVLLAGLVTWAVLNRPLPMSVSAAPVSSLAPPAIAPLPANDLPPQVVNFSRPEPKPAPLPWSSWLALVWLAGATVMIFRGGFQVAGAERLRRSSRPLEDARIAGLLEDARRAVGLARRVRLVATDKLTSPAVVGVVVPTLILPLSLTTMLTPEQIRFVLLHELAHIRRGDYFASLFQLFAEALLFFNPAVWWISRQMRVEREACCDALAIELSGAPVDYAKTLLCVAENVLQPMPAAAPAFGDRREPSSLADRVQRLLIPGYRPKLRLTWRAMLLALFIGGGLLFLSALGTSVTVAAILSPQQRIERIEKKMAEMGEKPEAENFSRDSENVPKVNLAGQVRTADGSPVPKWIGLNLNSSVKRSSYGTMISARNGFFTNSIRAGNIIIGAEVTDFAPAFIGPLNGFATNRFENLEIVLQRGFDVPLQLVDAENGQPLAQARGTAMFWLSNEGFQPHSWKSGADGAITLTHCVDLPLDVTVNAPGYEITRKKFDHVRAGEPLRVELRRGASESGVVLDKLTGQPVSGAEVRLLYQKDVGNFQWNDSFYSLGKTAANGTFALNQLRPGIQYYLGVSAPGHASVIFDHIPGGKNDLTIQLGPELIVRGQVIGSLDGLQVIDHDRCLDRNFSDVFGNHSCGFQEWVRLCVTNGVTTFQFTNRSAGPVTLTSETGYREEREVTAPIDDWVVDLAKVKNSKAKDLPQREVVFRFKDSSGVPPRGTVAVTIPDNLEPNHLTAHMQDMQITNGEVHVQIPIGGRTDIEAKRMVGFWFNRAGNWKSPTGESGDWLSIEVHSNASPLVIDVPLIPAGAIYASAKNADGTPAGGLFFGVTELKRAPGRDQNSLDSDGDGFSDNSPRKWVSGPLPLGGTYQVYAWRGNLFCVSQPVKLTEANPDAEVELQFPPGKVFNGVVLDADGKPLRDAELNFTFNLPIGHEETHGFGLKSVYTDARGRFQFENATPDLGEYTVAASAPGMMAESVKLDFKSQPQTIRLQRGRTLAGRVVEAGTGLVIPGSEVRVWTDGGKLPAQTTHTDADGRFEFNNLGDASYTVFVEDGQSVSNQKYRADGSTNLTVAVKLYAWSKVKPKVPVSTNFMGGISPSNQPGTITGILSDPNFRMVIHALEQRSGVETMPEPEVVTRSGRGVNSITMTNISVPVSKNDTGQLVQDGKLLYEMGKWPEAEAKLKATLALDSENATAKYYLGLMKTNWVVPKSVNTYTGPGRQEIVKQLHEIRLDRVEFKATPLGEVMRYLSQQAMPNDPEKKGINFLFNPNPDRSGQPNLTADSLNAIDLPHTNVLITIDSPLTNAPLGDVLDAMVRGASEPIYYSIQDFAVVFSAGKPAQPLFTRVFKVDTNSFLNALRKDTGLQTTNVSAMARSLFSKLGVDWESPIGKAVFYNDRLGKLFIKATEADLDTIERAIEVLNSVPPQLHIKARFLEVPKGTLFGLTNVISTTNQPSSSNQVAALVGILTDKNFRTVLRKLETLPGAETLAEPEVVTTSGRQTQMRVTDVVSIITNMTAFENPTNREVSIFPQVCQVETGVMLDVIPRVLADGYTLSLALIPSWTEFHGYAKTNTHAFYTSSGERIDVPGVHPLFNVQQLTATVNLWDSQTAILGGMTIHKVRAEKIPLLGDLPWMGSLFRKRQTTESDILVFITATIVDPAGNRVHTDDELPFAQQGTPPQPK